MTVGAEVEGAFAAVDAGLGPVTLAVACAETDTVSYRLATPSAAPPTHRSPACRTAAWPFLEAAVG